jgi:hypothetical protein
MPRADPFYPLSTPYHTDIDGAVYHEFEYSLVYVRN